MHTLSFINFCSFFAIINNAIVNILLRSVVCMTDLQEADKGESTPKLSSENVPIYNDTIMRVHSPEVLPMVVIRFL